MNKLLTALLCVALVLLTLCVSIALPIYVRPFYYLQIEELNLPEATGYSKEEIKTAYDEVLDYLTLPNRPFGTGVFSHSAEGAAHFADCKGLFRFLVLGASAVFEPCSCAELFHKEKSFCAL